MAKKKAKKFGAILKKRKKTKKKTRSAAAAHKMAKKKRARSKSRATSGRKGGASAQKQARSSTDSAAAKKKSAKKKSSKAGKKDDPIPQLRAYCWKPGQSGNPGGRPKGSYSIMAKIREVLRMPYPRGDGEEPTPDYTVRDEIAHIIIEKAIKGGFPFVKELIERVDGKVPDHVVVESTKRMVAQESANVSRWLLDLVEAEAHSMFDEEVATLLMTNLKARVIAKYEEEEGEAEQDGETE